MGSALFAGLIALTPWIQNLEESIGLDLLFHLRGETTPPDETIIIAMDRASAKTLKVPEKKGIWPRQHHTHLVKQLDEAGVKVIVFDVLFKNKQSDIVDSAFAQAIQDAGNVILFEYLDKDETGSQTNHLIVNKQLRPIPKLRRSAAATATFPLPKVPFKVSQYWKFTPGAGDSPSLPAVALQIYLLDYFPTFIEQLPSLSIQGNEELTLVMKTIRQRLIANPYRPSNAANNSAKALTLSSLYNNKNSEYLNFYGEAQTITTIPYNQVLAMDSKTRRLIFNNKAVFIGASDSRQWNQHDSFHTTFTDKDGLDISGVEIAATAFSNLLEANSIQPLSSSQAFALIVIWGIIIGLLCSTLPSVICLISVFGLSIIYLTIATAVFTSNNLWLPIVMPLLIQASIILLASVIYRSVLANREKNKIIQTFTQFIPEHEIKHLLETHTAQHSKGNVVSGVTLFTDIEQYTSLSEALSPDELSRLINQYHKNIFSIIHQHGGYISDAKGDSVLAIWSADEQGVEIYSAACQAALDISQAIDKFNTLRPEHPLPTRIGLHCGEFHLGIAGSNNHYEYRATGDCINTCARITGMNKYLGTKILASEQILKRANNIMTRALGRFKLVGKEKTVNLSELLSKQTDKESPAIFAQHSFSTGLDLFRKQQWQDAERHFLNHHKDDSAANFYIECCHKYQQSTLPQGWDG